MKFMEKAKRFFTLSAKHEGFTLVELIVVIAILAILAGIAVPAYSGYIKKADKAGDVQLLSSVNAAFAAAYLDATNHDMAELTSAGLTLAADGSVESVSCASPKSAEVSAAFDIYFEGNTGKFKFLVKPGDIVFVPGVGFQSKDDVRPGTNYAISYGDGSISIDNGKVSALKNTTFFSSMGTEGMLNKMSDVTGIAALMGEDSAMQTVYDSDAFKQHAADAMGVDADVNDPDFEEKMYEKLDPMCQELAEKEGITWDAAYDKIQANAAVIHAAKNASEMKSEDIISLLTSDNATATIQGKLSTDPSAALSEAALAYGMYTAYAHSTGDQNLIDSTDDPLTILRNLNDEGFKEYMASEQAKTDLEGYKSALSIINDTSKDTNAVSSVLVDGFNNEELVSILGNVFGN